MASLWDCEKCGYNHYEKSEKCKNCGTESNLPDMINEPPHYKDASGIECIEVTKHMSFCGGSCFMHLYEAGQNGSTVEDLKKAKWYAERAWIMNEIVSDEVINKITDIASFRLVGIADVMTAISESDWYKAGFAINDEIARLESE